MCSLGVHGAHCSALASRVADYPQTIEGVEVWGYASDGCSKQAQLWQPDEHRMVESV